MIRGFTRSTLSILVSCCVLIATSLAWASTQQADAPSEVEYDGGTGSNAPTGGPGDPQVPVCKPVNGIVTDVRGRPLFQARVWGYNVKQTPNCTGNSYTMTDPAGRYTVFLPAGQLGGTLYASKERFSTQAQGVPHPNPDDPTMNLTVDFQLRYLYTVSVSPTNFNGTSQTLTFDSYTTAPITETDASGVLRTAQAEVIPAANERVSLQVVTAPGDPPDQVHWRGTWTMPSGAADGTYTFSSCAYDPTLSSTGCAANGTNLVSDVATTSANLDRVVPTFSNTFPTPNHNTLNRRPVISSSVVDALSGVNWSAVTMQIQRPDASVTSVSGSSYSPPSDLALGVYNVTATAADLAGNIANTSWEFNVTTLEASAATGSLVSQTVAVNPQGKVIDAPTSVTFTNVQVDLSGYDLVLGPSAYSGYGTYARTLSLADVEVVFSNESPVTQSRNPNLGPQTFIAKAAIAFPEPGSTTAHISPSSIVIPSVTVSNLPTGYNTPGSHATIRMTAKAAGGLNVFEGTPGQASSDPTPYTIPPRSPSTIVISQSLVVGLPEYGAATVSPGPTTSDGVITVAGAPISLFGTALIDPMPPGEGDQPFDSEPYVDCPGSCLSQPSSTQKYISHTQPGLNLGDGAVKFFPNHWLYQLADRAHFIDWQQTSAKANSAAACLGLFTNSSQASNWSVGSDPSIPTSAGTGLFQMQHAWGSNRIEARDRQSSTFSSSLDSNFSADHGTNWARGQWDLAPEGGTQTSGSVSWEKLVSAVEFSSPTPSTLVQSHTLEFWTGPCN